MVFNQKSDKVDYGYQSLVYVNSASNIKIVNSEIAGQITQAKEGQSVKDINENGTIVGYAAGVGVTLKNTENITLDNNEVHTLKQGIQFAARGLNEQTVILNSHIHSIRADGIRGTDHNNTTIENNLFENFSRYIRDENNPDGRYDDHADMIQYWGTNAQFGIKNFTIQNNVFKQDDGETQTIFGRENANVNTSEDASLENFTIIGNVIYNGHLNAITLSDIDGVVAQDNVLVANHSVSDEGGYGNAPRVNIGNISNADISNNVTTYSWDKAIRLRGEDHRNPSPELYEENNINIEGTIFLSSRSDDPDFIHNVFEGADRQDLSLEELNAIVVDGLKSIGVNDDIINAATETFEVVIEGPENSDFDNANSNQDDNNESAIYANAYTRGSDEDDIFQLLNMRADINNQEGSDYFMLDALSDERFHRIRNFDSDDTLDISDLLDGFDADEDDISDFLVFEEVSWHGKDHTFVNVDESGAGEHSHAIILTYTTDLDLQSMIDSGQITIM